MTDEILLLISEDDRTFHVGTREVLRQHSQQAQPEAARSRATNSAESRFISTGALEVFDSTGNRTSTPDAEAAPARQATGDRLSEAVLLARINAVLDNLQALLDAEPTLGDIGPDDPRVNQVPRPQGTLPEVLQQLATEFALGSGDSYSRNRGNFVHMLAHAAGLAHRG